MGKQPDLVKRDQIGVWHNTLVQSTSVMSHCELLAARVAIEIQILTDEGDDRVHDSKELSLPPTSVWISHRRMAGKLYTQAPMQVPV
jgi:hypothetical protein